MPTAPTSGRGRTRTSEQAWHKWWILNRWAFLPDRAEVERRQHRVATAGAKDALTFANEQRRAAAQRWIIPFLAQQLDPKFKVTDEVRASSVLALTRVSNDGAAITLAFTWATDRYAANIVRESAALALGLLRRSDPALRVPAVDLDRVRNGLLDIYDDTKIPWRTRTFALLALGLLGDQPFGDGVHREGLILSRALWMRLTKVEPNTEEVVGLLTALGMQPKTGIPETVKEHLRQISVGKRAFGRRWSDLERSHALTALVRLDAPGWPVWLMRVLSSRQTPLAVHRAAWIAVGARAGDFTPDERREVAGIWIAAERRAREPIARGLMRLAQGRLLAADIADKRLDLLQDTPLARTLLASAASSHATYAASR